MICQAGKPQEEGPSQHNSSQILSSSTQKKKEAPKKPPRGRLGNQNRTSKSDFWPFCVFLIFFASFSHEHEPFFSGANPGAWKLLGLETIFMAEVCPGQSSLLGPSRLVNFWFYSPTLMLGPSRLVNFWFYSPTLMQGNLGAVFDWNIVLGQQANMSS